MSITIFQFKFMKKILNITIIVFCFFLLFGVSEIVFIYNNKPELVENYYVWVSQKVVNLSLKKSVNLILASATRCDIRTRGGFNPYPNEYLVNYVNISKNDILTRDFKEYIQNKKMFNLCEKESYTYQRIFYDLALIAYKDKEPQLFVTLLQLATIIDPGFSYWPVELANYYYSIDNKEKAFAILNMCQQIPNTNLHCSQVETFFNDGNIPFEIGFLKSAVDDIYKKLDINF